MVFLPIMVASSLQGLTTSVEPPPVPCSPGHRFSRLGFFITPTHVEGEVYQKGLPWLP
jgi:hypothetical protein